MKTIENNSVDWKHKQNLIFKLESMESQQQQQQKRKKRDCSFRGSLDS